jgi:feruloyl esterase
VTDGEEGGTVETARGPEIHGVRQEAAIEEGSAGRTELTILCPPCAISMTAGPATTFTIPAAVRQSTCITAIASMLFLIGSVCPSFAQTPSRCEGLARLSIPETAVMAAQIVAAGAFSSANQAGQGQLFARLPAFCRVALVSRPSADSEINIEVWLPMAGWNGKLQAVGDGGLAGSIPVLLMAPALARGYVATGTDTGHVGGTASFMPAHPEKLVDFAHRSTHQMAVASKAVVEGFYGTPPRWSYYNACSGGGRHALTSAQRYPADFNGIVAGAASWDQARLDAARIAINLTVNRTLETRIPAAKYRAIHDAVLRACDAADGAADGVLEDPRRCEFDYASLACKGPDGPSCLTTPQVESAKVLTTPFRDAATGRTLLEAHLWPGAELEWDVLGGPRPLTNSLQRVRNFHLKDPGWEFRIPNIPADIDRAVRMDGGLLASNNFDLKPFFDRGGKLLMWHGWSDPQVPAQHSVVFFENVLRTVGPSADQSIALFMLPGVSHCGGGEGPDEFDRMAAITEWAERGRKPTAIVASRVTQGKVDRTRPLCPFPQVAQYSGRGSTDDATNFSCAAPSPGSLPQRP